LFLLLENAKTNGIINLINTVLVFDRPSTNKFKMNHIKTILCGQYIDTDRLERTKRLQGDPLVEAVEISVKEPDRMTFSHKFL
jgi:hypothetical protein